MKKNLTCFSSLFMCFGIVILFACNSETSAQGVKPFAGKWQGMTYGSGAYDPMFTCQIKANGTWTDLSFGEAKALTGKCIADNKKKTITLFTAKGSKLYTFTIEAATKNQKERLVEQLPATESYRAMVCYRKS
ncbi:MAG: hypothetical protein WKF88_09640 [Ferruginibacter sp.]